MKQRNTDEIMKEIPAFVQERVQDKALSEYREKNKKIQNLISSFLSRQNLPKLEFHDFWEIHEAVKSTVITGVQDKDVRQIEKKDILIFRHELYDLLHGDAPLMNRYLMFKKHNPGFGPANISFLLSVSYPQDYMVVNVHSVRAINRYDMLGYEKQILAEDLFKRKNSDNYEEFVRYCRNICNMMKTDHTVPDADLLTVHEFFYYLTKIGNPKIPGR